MMGCGHYKCSFVLERLICMLRHSPNDKHSTGVLQMSSSCVYDTKWAGLMKQYFFCLERIVISVVTKKNTIRSFMVSYWCHLISSGLEQRRIETYRPSDCFLCFYRSHGDSSYPFSFLWFSEFDHVSLILIVMIIWAAICLRMFLYNLSLQWG